MSDGEWIKLFFYLFQYRDSYSSEVVCVDSCPESFLFTRDHLGQRTVQLQEGYDVGKSKVGLSGENELCRCFRTFVFASFRKAT